MRISACSRGFTPTPITLSLRFIKNFTTTYQRRVGQVVGGYLKLVSAKPQCNGCRGFTFIEIMVVVAIIMALSAVAIVSLGAMQERMVLNSTTSELIFNLEEAKSRAVAGVAGTQHGIYFASDHYVQFRGSEYDSGDPLNNVYEIDARLELSTAILDDEESIIFSRITGATNGSHLITITVKGKELSRSILVGSGGEIGRDD